METGVPHISEAQAVYLEKFLNHRGTIADLAAGMDVPLVDMIDILSSPAVLARIDDARILTQLKLEIIAARAEMAALETLEEITKNKSHDPVERRRAAQTIIRATRPIRARSQSKKVAPLSARFPGTNSQIQNRIRQEAAARQRHGNNQTSDFQEEDPPSPSDSSPSSVPSSPPLMPAVDPAIYLVDEDDLEETPLPTDLLPEQSPKVEPLSERCSPKVADTSMSHRTTGKLLTEQLDKPLTERCHQESDSPSQNRACQEAAAGHTNHNNHTTQHLDEENALSCSSQSPPTSSPCRSVASSLSPKDNPWETHPFARAFRSFSSQSPTPSLPSTHDPP